MASAPHLLAITQLLTRHQTPLPSQHVVALAYSSGRGQASHVTHFTEATSEREPMLLTTALKVWITTPKVPRRLRSACDEDVVVEMELRLGVCR